jgi:hypothetical protein
MAWMFRYTTALFTICNECMDDSIKMKEGIMTEAKEEHCEWKQTDEWEGTVWDSDCGESFYLEEGTPKDNGMNFCAYCGRKLKCC